MISLILSRSLSLYSPQRAHHIGLHLQFTHGHLGGAYQMWAGELQLQLQALLLLRDIGQGAQCCRQLVERVQWRTLEATRGARFVEHL